MSQYSSSLENAASQAKEEHYVTLCDLRSKTFCYTRGSGAVARLAQNLTGSSLCDEPCVTQPARKTCDKRMRHFPIMLRDVVAVIVEETLCDVP